MAVVPEADRAEAMVRLGLSDALIRLASGEPPHEAFTLDCEAPPRLSYREGNSSPDGPEFIPLYDNDNEVFGVWEKDGGPEFIQFFDDTPRLYDVISRTEQGFLALAVDAIYSRTVTGDKESMAALRAAAAAAVGFRFLDELIAWNEAQEWSPEHITERRFVKEFVARIDDVVLAEPRPERPPRVGADRPARREARVVSDGDLLGHADLLSLGDDLRALFAGELDDDVVQVVRLLPDGEEDAVIEYTRTRAGAVRLEFEFGAPSPAATAAEGLGFRKTRDIPLSGTSGRGKSSRRIHQYRLPLTDPHQAERLGRAVLKRVFRIAVSDELEVRIGPDEVD